MDYDSYSEHLNEMREQAATERLGGVNAAMQEIAELTNRLDESEPYLTLQLAVMLEEQFDHRTTFAAVDRLVDDGILSKRQVPSIDRPVDFVYPAGTSPTERINELAAIVWKMRSPEVRKGCQEHARSLIRLALTGHGFMVTPGDRTADMIAERDGVRYGVVVHNYLKEIEVGAMELKVAVCHRENLTPVFFSRTSSRQGCMAVLEGGAFCDHFSHYIMPFLLDSLARQMKNSLMLPVEIAEQMPAGIIKQFMRWHVYRMSR